MMAMAQSDPWADTWSEAEGRQFWNGYEEFLDRIGTLSDDERTIAIEVLA